MHACSSRHSGAPIRAPPTADKSRVRESRMASQTSWVIDCMESSPRSGVGHQHPKKCCWHPRSDPPAMLRRIGGRAARKRSVSSVYNCKTCTIQFAAAVRKANLVRYTIGNTNDSSYGKDVRKRLYVDVVTYAAVHSPP